MGRLLLLISRNTNVACMSLLLMVAYVPCEFQEVPVLLMSAAMLIRDSIALSFLIIMGLYY